MKNAAKTTILLTLTMLLLALGACYHPPKFRVAVIDNFYPERTTFSSTESRNLFTLGYGRDIDGDDKADPILHGDLVAIFWEDPRIEIVKIAAPYQDLVTGLLGSLNQIERRIARGEHFDAISISMEFGMPRFVFVDEDKGPILMEERVLYREIIREWSLMEDHPKRLMFRAANEILNQLERIAALGPRIFIPIGNSGPRYVNVLSFAPGVETVGSSGSFGLDTWATNTGLVTLKGPVRFEVIRVWEGYDITGDGVADIPLEDTSSLGRGFGPDLVGTSFTVPVAAKAELLGR